MARQARSTATRARIVTAAVDLFMEKSYATTNLGDIVERAQLTKGALYYHFDSKESLANAIIDEGASVVLERFRLVCASPAPAMENMIHATFVIAGAMHEDKVAYMGAVLARTLGGSLEAPNKIYDGLLKAYTEQAELAAREGDLNPEVEPTAAAELVLCSALGAELLAAAGQPDGSTLLIRLWQTLLPGLAAPGPLPYFRQYLARETLRHDQ